MTPEDAGLKRAKPADLKGGSPAANAARMLSLLGGEKGPLRDVVLFNAAAALIIAGNAKDLKDGMAQAAKSVDSGAARRALDSLIAITNEPAGLTRGSAA